LSRVATYSAAAPLIEMTMKSATSLNLTPGLSLP